MSTPYEGLQNLVDQLPEFLQPLIVAGLGTIPYVEGEGSAAIGILLGINPIVAAVAGAAGNILCVVLVVLLSSRVRQAVVTRRAKARETATVAAGDGTGAVASDAQTTAGADTTTVQTDAAGDGAQPQTRRAKGRRRLAAWLVRFGVPGASIIAPFALPTQLTAAFFVASGVSKAWVILWQAVAIVLWTGLIAAAALGLVTVLGW